MLHMKESSCSHFKGCKFVWDVFVPGIGAGGLGTGREMVQLYTSKHLAGTGAFLGADKTFC